MGEIEYDKSSADLLERQALKAATVLRNQGATRRGAVETATVDFSGAYAERFKESAQTESSDRARLANVLESLSRRVHEVSDAAERESQRRTDLAAWRARQVQREQQAAASPLAVFGVRAVAGLDFEPSTVPISPPPISFAFTPRARPRTGQGSPAGSSSADPERLRSFVRSARSSDVLVSSAASRVRSAWAGFVSACGWARVESSTFLVGLERFLHEDAEDASWVERIAAAFERAGSIGSLSNTTLDIMAGASLPAPILALFRDGLTSSQIARKWMELSANGLKLSDLSGLPSAVLSRLGNLEGIPYAVRAGANEITLRIRIDEAERRLKKFADDDQYDVGRASFATAFENLRSLENISDALVKGRRAGDRFLIALSEDVPPLAAIAIGHLDRAKNVTWAVPGMGSDTTGMTAWASAAQNLYDQQAKTYDEEHAVIAWMGYKSPPVPVVSGRADFGVLGSTYAQPGGDQLAASIRGLDAVRSGDTPTTNVVAHSYGSTAAAYGLIERGVHVNTFTTVGSAGIPTAIPDAAALHADHVYAGQARNVWAVDSERGDQWAATGRLGPTHSTDPTAASFGATTFGADGSGELSPVKDHGVHTDDGRGYLDQNTESLTNVGFATTGHPEKLTKSHPKGLTEFEKFVLDGAY